MNEKRQMLRHFLGALAYRTQKALRGASDSFAGFNAGGGARTPMELVRHMASVLGYARTFFIGGSYRPEPLETFEGEIEDVAILASLCDLIYSISFIILFISVDTINLFFTLIIIKIIINHLQAIDIIEAIYY